MARGPWRATYWNQTFSHQADTTLLLLLSGDKSTSCSWQSQIPSFAPLQVAIKRPPKLFQFAGKQEMRRPCTIHSPSFAMTDNFSCKSFKSWATVIPKIGEGGGVTHNCPKLEKYLFPGFSGCIFAPGTRGPGESSCPEGSEYVWQRGIGSQKCLVMGNFQSVLPGS